MKTVSCARTQLRLATWMGGEARGDGAAGLQPHATVDETSAAVLQSGQKMPATAMETRSETTKPKRAPSTKVARGGAKSTPRTARRVPNEKMIKTRFRPPGFTKFDKLPSRPMEFAEVEAGFLRHTRGECGVRPDVTAVREVLTLVGDETMCVLNVDDGP